MEDKWVVGLALGGVAVGIILIALLVYIICCCCRKRDGDHPSAVIFFHSKEQKDPLIDIPCEPGYTPDDFQFAGELQVKPFEFNDQTLNELPPPDENPPDAHFQHTTGAGNIVYEINDGSKKVNRQ